MRKFALFLLALVSLVIARASVTEDISHLTPLIKKGRLLYVLETVSFDGKAPEMHLRRAVYSTADVSAFCDSLQGFNVILEREFGADVPDSSIVQNQIPRLFWLAWMSARGHLIDSSYLETRSREGPAERVSIDAIRELAPVPKLSDRSEEWLLEFSVIYEDSEKCGLEHWSVGGRWKPFRVSKVRNEIVETSVGITPLWR